MRSLLRPSATATATALALALVVTTPAGAVHAQQQPTAVGSGGAVATEHPGASAAATEMLERGGNAIDAAVAAAAAQGVTRPFSGGVGGDGFMLIHRADGESVVLDHRAAAPASFGPDAFVDPATGQIVSSSERVTSGAAVAVPGAARAWEQALDEHGTMGLDEVLQPAIDLAEEGFAADQTYVDEVSRHRSRFRSFTSTRATFLTSAGNPPGVGSTIRNPDLASTYRALADEGAEVFYTGRIAQAIRDTVNDPPLHSTNTRNVLPGAMTLADLAAYRVIARKPVETTYRGYTVLGAPPPSSGGVSIGLALNMLEGFGLPTMSRSELLHHYLEASRVAFADHVWLGDPAFNAMPTSGMLSAGYADQRRSLIGEQAAESRVAAGDPWGYEPGVASASERAQNDPVLRPEDEEQSTIHLTVADDAGNVVAHTSTIVQIGGNGMVVPGHGFLLNNSLSGRVPGSDLDAPNAPRPGMRTRSSMSPTIVTRDGEPVLALGAPGNASIITSVLQILTEHLSHGTPLPTALAAPRLSQRNWRSTAAEVEPEVHGTAEADALEARGHRLDTTSISYGIGAVTAFARLPDGRLQAAAEPERRGGGSAMAVPARPARGVDDACRDTGGWDPGFTDVGGFPEPTRAAIACLSFYELARGYTDDAYRPSLDVQRYQMALFLARLVDYVAQTTDLELPDELPDAGFADTRALSIEAQEAISLLRFLGVTEGTSATRFSPSASVTRRDMASFLVRLQDLLEDGSYATNAGWFPDVPQKMARSEDVNALAAQGIVGGYADGSYGPHLPVRRAEMALFLMRLVDENVDADRLPARTTPPSGS